MKSAVCLPCLILLLAAAGQGQTRDWTPEAQEQFIRGIEAQKIGDLERAENTFKKLIDQGARFPQLYNALGNVYQLRGAHEQALEAFKESERLDPKDPDHHSLAGVSLLALDKPREAVGEFRQAVRLLPENPLFREQLARACLRLEDYPAAIDQYTKLLEMKADSTEYQYQLGRAYQAYSAACFEKIKQIDEGSARLYQEMGDQYLAQGRLDKTIKSYEKARTADPSIPEVHFLLGQFYLKQGDKEKALQAVNEALALTPGSPAALALKKAILGKR